MRYFRLLVFACLAIAGDARAITWHVSTNSPVNGPGDAWSNAFWDIQSAVDSATNGDVVLVADGIYRTGSRAVPQLQSSNRVVVNKSIRVQSANGPANAIIYGTEVQAPPALRCVYLAAGASLSGFTILNGYAGMDDDAGAFTNKGGGIYCAAASAVISNCIFESNNANWEGGALVGGTAYDCIFRGNTAQNQGGAAMGSTLRRCLLLNNSAYSGGGLYGGTAFRCSFISNSAALGGAAMDSSVDLSVLAFNNAFSGGGTENGASTGCAYYKNYADHGGGAFGGVHRHSTFALNTGIGGAIRDAVGYNCLIFYNNVANLGLYDNGEVEFQMSEGCWVVPWRGTTHYDPGLVSPWRLATNAVCIGAASDAYTTSVDLDGQARRSPPTPGADEPYAVNGTGTLSLSISPASTQTWSGLSVRLSADVQGAPTGNEWDLGDGTRLTNVLLAQYGWATAGTYTVTLRTWNPDHPAGTTATATVVVVDPPTFYVAPGGGHIPPFDTWTKAANTIQAAIDAAPMTRALILVSNGLYNTGARRYAVYTKYTSSLTRVVIEKPIVVRSVNGPDVTIIEGQGPIGTGAVRCVHVPRDAVLDGFTLRNGHTSNKGHLEGSQQSAGAHCDPGSMLTNCIIVSNVAHQGSGGVRKSMLFNCVIRDNHGGQTVGGATDCILTDCVIMNNIGGMYGGGAMYGILTRCTVISNVAGLAGGGAAFASVVQNCVFEGNVALDRGGGVSETRAVNSTFVRNVAPIGGALYRGSAENCIFQGNSRPTLKLSSCANGLFAEYENTIVGGTFCWDCIYADPAFANTNAGNFSLTALSPGINTGRFVYLASGPVDRTGKARVTEGQVDIGAYEFNGTVLTDGDRDGLPDDWELAQGLSAVIPNSSQADADGDELTDWQEFVTGTEPTNSLSQFTPFRTDGSESGTQFVIEPAATGRLYRVFCATSLLEQTWAPCGPALPGNGGRLTIVVTNPLPQAAYRVSVGLP